MQHHNNNLILIKINFERDYKDLEKNEMKTTEVAIVIMIILGFIGGYDSPSIKIESHTVFANQLSCVARCGINCIFLTLCI